ncbi:MULTISPECIES: DUF4870 domain-containing protein [unclassified Salinibacterium]|uniref:DUF4870 domain-containing protein n=1 Tax=unclassified Salinibacterium TaxID=2632331 RepID=UPI00142347AB|nr:MULTISPECIES: DUF4870 domain-containing protein [unclassified Salinibacterium]
MTDPNAQPAQPVVPLTEAEDKQWASFAHLGGILSFVPALIIYLVFKDRGAFTRQEAKEALNFQITLVLAYVALWILGAILLFFVIGLLIWNATWLVWVAGVIFSILGFVSAKDGTAYRYPFNIRFIK